MTKTDSTKELPAFKLLNLSYMKQVSRNDLAYERGVTKVFIQTIPENLKELHKAVQLKSYLDLGKIFHHMQSSLSIMGLDKILNKFLDVEFSSEIDIEKLKEDINFIDSICTKAVEEAKQYLYSIS